MFRVIETGRNLKVSEILTVETKSFDAVADWKAIVLKILVGFLLVFLVLEVLFYIVYIPATSRIRLSFEGNTSLGYDELCSLSGIGGLERWMSFDTVQTASLLASNPLFESVSIEKKFPDRVVVTLQERTPVAIAFGLVDGRTIPFEIDKNGVAFRFGSACSATNLPLLTGLTFENPVPGMRLHSQLHTLLNDISILEMHNAALLSSVSEIKIVEKTYGGYDLVVYPVHTPIRVRTDKALNEESLQYMMLVLDVVQDLSLSVDEIDIRAGTVAYRVKGEQI